LSVNMKFLVLLLFCLVSVSVFVAAEEEDGKLLSFFPHVFNPFCYELRLVIALTYTVDMFKTSRSHPTYTLPLLRCREFNLHEAGFSVLLSINLLLDDLKI